MVRRALCKIIKVALTKELGKNAKLLYKIKMEILRQQTTVHGTIAKCKSRTHEIPKHAPYKNLDPELRILCNSWNQEFKN
jgi:chromosomal replication initiator protein